MRINRMRAILSMRRGSTKKVTESDDELVTLYGRHLRALRSGGSADYRSPTPHTRPPKSDPPVAATAVATAVALAAAEDPPA